MKKFVLLFLVGTFLPLFLFAQQKVTKNNSEDIPVYITKTGKKYHSANCFYLKGGGIPKKLSEVKDSYSPCSKCNPQTTQIEKDNNKQQQATTQQQTSTETTSKGQPIYTGPRGGKYHYSKSGKKVYERKKKK
ncbi:MAG: hypothetical protein HOO91_13270 [Bacteroidales bacterium]|nr:hypothetical protein [Bacteroidales bacterium]